MKITNFLRTTALVSPVMMFALTPGLGLADTEGDNIQINQSAETKDSLSNTASVTLGGENTSIMAVGGSGEIAQLGDENSAEFTINGNLNTIYFAQTGNSIVTMSLDGDNNTITLNEFGGGERLASLNLSVSGESNDVELSSNEIYAVAELLEIKIADSDYNMVKVTYDDYSSIVAEILGSGSNVTIAQNERNYYDDLASGDRNNSVKLFVDSVSEKNEIYLSQYGYGSFADVNVTGGGNSVRVYQDNYGFDNNNSSDLVLNLDGFDNEVHLYQYSYLEQNSDLSASVTGNRNRVDGYGHDGPIELDINGSDNEILLESNSEVFVLGSDNAVTHSFYSYNLDDPEEFSSFDTSVVGDNNEFYIAGYGYYDNTGALLDVFTDILGHDNTVRLDFWSEEAGVFGSSRRSINTFVTGDMNSITATDYINLGADYAGEVLSFDIMGDSNDIAFGQIGSEGLDATISGNDNSMTFRATDDAFAEIYGDNNILSLIDTSSSVKTNYTIEGDGNSAAVNNVFATLLDIELYGDYNTSTVSGVDELKLSLHVAGMSNSYKQEMQDIYGDSPFAFTVDTKMYGDYNSITVSSVPEYAYSSLALTVDGLSNSLNVAGVGFDILEERSNVTVDILGDYNTVNVVAGPTAGLTIDGSDYNVDSTYDADLSIYVNSISNVGIGNVTFTTADGEVSVDAT